MKTIKSLVVTGGPCSGKTTALSIIEQELTSRGYYVLTIPETATQLISSGIKPNNGTLLPKQFQLIVARMQLEKEKLYRFVAQLHPSKKIVLLHDRGIIDGKSYVTEEEFSFVLDYLKITEIYARSHYDAVFHLVTAANGAEEYYTLENNAARTETAEEAVELDLKGIANWSGHPNFKIIDNSTDFEGKMSRLMNEIYLALGIPTVQEIANKFLVEVPALDDLSSYVSFTKVDMVQTYLKSSDGTERRLRQIGQDGDYAYYLTEKRENENGENSKRRETQRRISAKEYLSYLSQIDNELKPIIKKRLCFAYNNQYFKLDIFNFSDEFAILEIDVATGSTIQIPDFIKVVKDVTNDLNFRNYNLSRFQSFTLE